MKTNVVGADRSCSRSGRPRQLHAVGGVRRLLGSGDPAHRDHPHPPAAQAPTRCATASSPTRPTLSSTTASPTARRSRRPTASPGKHGLYGFQFVVMNTTQPPFDNVALRQAVLKGTDRAATRHGRPRARDAGGRHPDPEERAAVPDRHRAVDARRRRRQEVDRRQRAGRHRGRGADRRPPLRPSLRSGHPGQPRSDRSQAEGRDPRRGRLPRPGVHEQDVPTRHHRRRVAARPVAVPQPLPHDHRIDGGDPESRTSISTTCSTGPASCTTMQSTLRCTSRRWSWSSTRRRRSTVRERPRPSRRSPTSPGSASSRTPTSTFAGVVIAWIASQVGPDLCGDWSFDGC